MSRKRKNMEPIEQLAANNDISDEEIENSEQSQEVESSHL